MARHRARSVRMSVIVAAVAVAFATLLAALVGQQTAGAKVLPPPPGKSVHMNNADVLSHCSLTVLSVDSTTYDTTTQITAQAQPASAFGYAHNVFTQVTCQVYSSHGTLLATFRPSTDYPVMSTQAKKFTLPYDTSYGLCGQTLVKLSSGNTSTTARVCG